LSIAEAICFRWSPSPIQRRRGAHSSLYGASGESLNADRNSMADHFLGLVAADFNEN